MPRIFVFALSMIVAPIVTGCAAHGRASSAHDPARDSATASAPVTTWEAPMPGLTRVEIWLRAGSLDANEPLVAAIMAEIWAARAEAESWVTPSLSVLTVEASSDELEARTSRLLSALREPPEASELERAAAAVAESRRRQSHAPEREAIAAAFEAMGHVTALPLGEEDDPLPSIASLHEFASRAVGRDAVRVLFIGEAPEKLVKRTKRAVESLGEGTGRPPRAAREARAVGFRTGTPAWALVATLGSLEAAKSARDLVKHGPFELGDARVELAPSHLGAFLVVSGRGPLSAASLEGWVLEIRRLASWSGAAARPPALDLRERARAAALSFAVAPLDRAAEPRFDLGVTAKREADVDLAALAEALQAEVEPVVVESEDRGEDVSVVARFPALFSGEPASDAGRGALLLRVLADTCARLGLEAAPSTAGGDGVLAFRFTDPPPLAAIQALTRCVLRDVPSEIVWESMRAQLLGELADDPLHEALEAAAAALYPSAPSSALPLQTRALRHRGGGARMTSALAARRMRQGVRFAVSGPSHEAIAAQLGAIGARVPSAPRPFQPLENPRPDLGPRVVELAHADVFVAGARLDGPSRARALAFATSWAKRVKERGLPVLRLVSGGHAREGFALLVVPLGRADPEALRALIEDASPSGEDLADALRAVERELSFRPRIAGEPAEALGVEAPPRVTGRAYVLGSVPDGS